MSHFFVRACPEGHYEINYKPVREGNICKRCGGQVIDRCPACGRIIKDWNFYGSSMMPPVAKDFVLPDKCAGCGAEFSWAGRQPIRIGNEQKR